MLGRARDRLTDKDHPPSEKAELEKIRESMKAQMPDAVANELAPPTTPSFQEPGGISGLVPPPTSK